jgi:hypothetical protein
MGTYEIHGIFDEFELQVDLLRRPIDGNDHIRNNQISRMETVISVAQWGHIVHRSRGRSLPAITSLPYVQ